MHNIGNPMSLNRIVEGLGTGRTLVGRCLELLMEAFVICRADRYDTVSSALNPSSKYCVVDSGLMCGAAGSAQSTWGACWITSSIWN